MNRGQKRWLTNLIERGSSDERYNMAGKQNDYVKGVLTYFVENKITGERRGTFDCEPWAKEMADELNREGVK